MRKLILISLLTAFSISLSAQRVFQKGDVMFNAGAGIPGVYGPIPSISFSGEIGVIPTGNIGLVSFGGLTEFHIGIDGDPFARFYIGPRAAWHLHSFASDEFDVYGGAGFGIAINGSNDFRPSNVIASPEVFVGGRWMFAKNAGLFAELGYTGLSVAKFGFTFGL